MVGAGKGVAALPVTIALCCEHILLVHVVSSSNFLNLVPVVQIKAVIFKGIRAEYEKNLSKKKT